jgi:hypothetical protein
MLHGSLVVSRRLKFSTFRSFKCVRQNSDREFSVMLGYTLPDDVPDYNEEWKDQYPLDHFNLDLQKFEPR